MIYDEQKENLCRADFRDIACSFDRMRRECRAGTARCSGADCCRNNPDPDKQGTAALKDSIVELGYTEDFDIDSKFNTDIYKNALDSLLAENPDDAVYLEQKKHFDEFE